MASHCTSMPTSVVRESDALLSLFFSLPSNVVNASRRRAEMREALRARAQSDPEAQEELRVGERVWAKWHAELGRRERGWYRATARVRSVGPGGVELAWVGRKGSVTTLSWQEARNMLVRAGRLAPRKRGAQQLGGAALVGRRVRVYWPGDDVCWAGEVKEWCEESGMHRVLYSDGDDVWELMGGPLAPEYVVDS